MKRVIVDYAKLTNEILTLLVEKFPEGYDDSDIVRFKNAKNENIEAVEVRTEDTIYLVKVSTKLADRIENYDEDDIDTVEELDAIKDLDINDNADDDTDDDDAETDKDMNDDLDPEDDDDDMDDDEESGTRKRKKQYDEEEDEDDDEE